MVARNESCQRFQVRLLPSSSPVPRSSIVNTTRTRGRRASKDILSITSGNCKFLWPVVAQSFRVLRCAGYLVLNVSNGNRLPSSSHVKELAGRAGFRLHSVGQMLFPKIPYLHPRNAGPVKSELLLVFRKV
jgi:hypothetical protein